MKKIGTLLIALSILIGYVSMMCVGIFAPAPVVEVVSPIVEQEEAEPEPQSVVVVEGIVDPPIVIEEEVPEPAPFIPDPEPVEYPIALYVWNWLIDHDWSEEAAAGVLGNFMAETGSGYKQLSKSDEVLQSNLDINPSNISNHGLGLVQWIGGRRKNIQNKYGNAPTKEEQLQFMLDELLGTNGVRRQVSQTEYELIINAETPEKAAEYFAKYYERCHNSTYSQRKRFAKIAYNYFTQR